jgi:hypothetical protein
MRRKIKTEQPEFHYSLLGIASHPFDVVEIIDVSEELVT